MCLNFAFFFWRPTWDRSVAVRFTGVQPRRSVAHSHQSLSGSRLELPHYIRSVLIFFISAFVVSLQSVLDIYFPSFLNTTHPKLSFFHISITDLSDFCPPHWPDCPQTCLNPSCAVSNYWTGNKKKKKNWEFILSWTLTKYRDRHIVSHLHPTQAMEKVSWPFTSLLIWKFSQLKKD